MNTKGNIKTAPREIRIFENATPPSLYVIDARKLMQPWITIEGEKPRVVMVLPPKPIAPRVPISLRKEEEANTENHGELLFDLFFVFLHPLRWYRQFEELREERDAEAARAITISALPDAPSLLRFTFPKIVLPSMHLARMQFPKLTATHRAAISFGVMSLVLLLPLHSLSSLSVFENKEKLEHQVAALQKELAEGTAPSTLTPSLFELMNTFRETEKQLGFGRGIVRLAASLPVELGSLQSSAALFEAGQAVSHAVLTLHQTLSALPNDAGTGAKATALSETIAELAPDIRQIRNSILRIDPDDVPEEARPYVVPLQKLVTAVDADMETITETTRALLALLGANAPARFLVLFQNDAELRATGGFIGSFGILDVADGSIKKFEIPETGSYAVQGQLTAYLRAPEPLQVVNTRFEFQDSNWFPDFPASAETAMRLYELSHGATVDGVIALNTKIIQGLLEVIGEISNPKNSAEKITSETIVAEIQNDIQKNKETGQAPKQILGMLAPAIMKSLEHLTPAQALQMVQLFNTARNYKDILVYAKDTKIQATLHELAWDGALPREKGQDFLMVVNSNIGGGKTDSEIEQKIVQRAIIAEDGTVKKQLSIVRTHTGKKETSGVNRDYLRVYVPEGARLIAASGFQEIPESMFHAPEIWYDEHPLIKEAEEGAVFDPKSGAKIYREFGKTVFANWVLTAPGETSIIEFEYELPNPVFDAATFKTGFLRMTPSFSYYVHVSKQPGDHGSELLTSIVLPSDWEPVWLANADMELGRETLIHRVTLNEDQLIGLVAAHE